MSDVTPGLVPAPSPAVQPAPALPPIPADPPSFSAPAGSISALAVLTTPVATPAPVTVASTPGGNAGVSEYAGDLGASVSAVLPAKVRLFIYPLGFAASLAAVSLSLAHVIDPASAALLALGAQAFTNGLATGNVNKVG